MMAAASVCCSNIFDAATEGHVQCIRHASQMQTDVNTRDENYKTSLIIACAKGHKDCIELLIEKGADINAKDKDGWNALISAASKGHRDCVEILLKHSVLDLNATQNDKWSAILLAGCMGEAECMELILKSGGDPNKTDSDGATALICAANEGHLECVEILLRYNADASIKDRANKTAMDYAKDKGNKECIELLGLMKMNTFSLRLISICWILNTHFVTNSTGASSEEDYGSTANSGTDADGTKNEENSGKGFLYGDIEISRHTFRNAMLNKDARWPNGFVPYSIVDVYPTWAVEIFKSAMKEIEANTSFNGQRCITFKERTFEENYVEIAPIGGCYSRVGVSGGKQPISLGAGCERKGTVIHELLHTLGFWHEQSRADRDMYIKVNWTNIKEGSAGNFNKFDDTSIDHQDMPYDYDSIMHYSAFSFAKDYRWPTIVPLIGKPYIGQRLQLSDIDINEIRKLYNCQGVVSVDFTTPMVTTLKPTTPPQPIGTDLPLYWECTFDEGRCGLENVENSLEWILQKGPTASSKTGPGSDHTSSTGNYIFTEASNQYQKKYKIVKTKLPKSNMCVDFWYHMYSENEEESDHHVGYLRFYAQSGNTEPTQLLAWERTRSQGNKWLNGRFTVRKSDISSKKWKLLVEGEILNNYKSDIAVDDLKIYKGRCP
ncbi:unnamed protein product [Owenia fusiformis]|uniref:Metalloendopeptidase n=1 Tax=Owenia fusiformis TaxID=6347 RepID=A0A8S4PPU3_OWEFU|nr:unnamed protein product [Owenia fusiformis]